MNPIFFWEIIKRFLNRLQEMAVLFGSKERTDVIWIDSELNEYYIHRLILEMRSDVFRNHEWETNTVFKTKFSPKASLEFLKLIYCFNIATHVIDQAALIEVSRICFQYNVYTKECIDWIEKKLQTDEVDNEFIDTCNFVADFQQTDLMKNIIDILKPRLTLTNTTLRGLSLGFKNMLIMYLYGSKIESEVKIIEAEDEYGYWYVAEQLRSRHNKVFVHYQGYPDSHNKWILKKRTSPIGTRMIKSQKDGQTQLEDISHIAYSEVSDSSSDDSN